MFNPVATNGGNKGMNGRGKVDYSMNQIIVRSESYQLQLHLLKQMGIGQEGRAQKRGEGLEHAPRLFAVAVHQAQHVGQGIEQEVRLHLGLAELELRFHGDLFHVQPVHFFLGDPGHREEHITYDRAEQEGEYLDLRKEPEAAPDEFSEGNAVRQCAEQSPRKGTEDQDNDDEQDLGPRGRRPLQERHCGRSAEKDGEAYALRKDKVRKEPPAEMDGRKDNGDDGVDDEIGEDPFQEMHGRKQLIVY